MTVTASMRFQELFDSLQDEEKVMYAALKQDAERAVEFNKPLLGLFTRRGQHRFVILREDCSFERDLLKSSRHRSKLVLSDKGTTSLDVINKLLCLLRLDGYRANELIQHSECLRHGVNSRYFEYHIDLEAA